MKHRRDNDIALPLDKMARIPFPYLTMLPEMQGEVVAHLLDIDDRVSLSITCTQLVASMHVPRLPPPWRPAWTLVCKEYPESARVLQHAVLEMIRVGVPTWPRVFKRAALAVIHYPETGPYLSWWWGKPGWSGRSLAWYPQEKMWRTGDEPWSWPASSLYTPLVTTSSLDELLQDTGADLREYIAQVRPRADGTVYPGSAHMNIPQPVYWFNFDE